MVLREAPPDQRGVVGPEDPSLGIVENDADDVLRRRGVVHRSGVEGGVGNRLWEEERGGQAARQEEARQVTGQRRVVGDHVADQQPATERAGNGGDHEHGEERDQGKLLHRGECPADAPAHQGNRTPAETLGNSSLMDLSTDTKRYLCTSDKGGRPPDARSIVGPGCFSRGQSRRNQTSTQRAPSARPRASASPSAPGSKSSGRSKSGADGSTTWTSTRWRRRPSSTSRRI